MRNITEEARLVMNTRRDFVNYAHVTLHDGTELNLTPSDFRISGNSFTDDWNEGESFQLGSSIGKTATLLLDNTDGRTEEISNGISKIYPHGKFSEYDFYMAYFELYLHLPKSTHYQGELIDEVIPIGTFTVTTPASHGSTIEITGVDNMHMFDKSFDDCTLDFSTGPTLLTVLNRCCQDCGVAIGYSSFLNESIRVYKKPEGLTYRQVVSYIAQIAGCNAVINITGALVLKYYDMTPLNEILDGGRFDWLDDKTINEGTYVTTSGSSPAPVDTYVSNRTTSLEGFFAARIYIDNISDLSAFNCKATIYYYSNSQYTTVETITLVEGYNDISTKMELQDDGNITWYTIRLGQQNSNAISFDYEIHITENLDGGSFNPWTGSADNAISGGNFTDTLDYHNLTATNGTSVSTDDIHFTGIMVSYEIVNSEGNTEKQALHYPDVTDWDTYAMHIEDNPFVETQAIANTVATSVWDIISPLNFRPFSCSSIQDPTIEAGDCALVYDVKGNIYPTVITNVRFTTGGMTEVSCTAESPVRQNTRYVNPAARAEAKAIQKQDDYNAMVARFNEIAYASTSYYTVTNPSEPGVTYLCDHSTIAASTNIVKIIGTGAFISTDGGQSYNAGVDTSTATMLMNLIYVKGLNADWIKAGTIDTARLNVSGIVNGINTGTTTINGGKITTNTITASQIQTGAVGADQIAANAVTAGKIQAGAVDTNKLAANAVTAAKLNVTSLDAITATMGNLNIDKNITISSNGSLGARGSAGSMNGAHIANGDLGIATDRGDSWSVLCYGQEAADRTEWSKACCVLWNGGDASAGFHVCNGAPNDHRTFTAMKDNIFQVYVENDLKAWFNETGAHTDSDKRRKKNIKSISTKNIRDFLKKINPVNYIYKKDKSGLIHYGLIAQDVKQAMDDSGLYSESVVQICPDADDTLFINYQEFHGIELSAIKDLYEIIQSQQTEINDLKKRVEALETLVNTNK